jgi:putative membrane protein
MAALSELALPSMGELMVIGVLASCAAYIITVRLSASAHLLKGFDSRVLNRGVIVFVVLLSIVLTGPFGLFILLLATTIGLVPHLVNIPRMYCMGAIMIPVMLYSFGFAWI